MKSCLGLLVLVGLACASTSPAFKDNTEYVYHVRGRTLTSLHEVSDQYSGIFLNAKLYITPRHDGKLHARIYEAQYAELHSRLPNSWDTYIPDSELSYKPLKLSEKPFQIILEDGLIRGLIVEKDIANWEANIIKSIVSQFQIDVRGKNAISSPVNTFPTEDQFDGVYKTMEETITGETETSYEIHRLPEYILQKKPWLVPQLKLKGNGHVIKVIKNKNYTNSYESPAYHYGFGELQYGAPTANRAGTFLTRQSKSFMVLTGKLTKFTIQNSHTFNKIIVNPTLNAKEQGSVVSSVNVTLHEVKTQSEKPQELSNPLEIGNLVYTYESPFAQSNEVFKKQQEHYYAQDSSEESTERYYHRLRRSSEQMIRKLQHEQDSSSSEENVQYQSKPDISQASASPLFPYNMGYYGRSIKTNPDFDLKQNIKRIAKEISEELQEPEKILSHSTLSKYVMLTALTRLMNEQEIKSVAEELYTQSKHGQERITWIAFRDAVAEAGSGPAFLNIQEWIESKKIEKEEASEVIAAMANSVRVPTEEYMHKFFEFIQKPVIIEQEYLNETAVLVYTSLVNRVYVNRNQSHYEYPVHTFGRFNTKEGKEFVKSTIIPYLTQQLHDAVSQADTRKIHVYIRSLGNVGHKHILKAFEPYLEGEKQVSQFQRMLMVLSLDKLVESYPTVARSVLYRIYQNSAEIPEVRVVAVYQLIRTRPSVEMIQRMAENTNTDPQEDVNAAVKSVIESISHLKSSEMQRLRKASESAKPLLTKKVYGKQQSFNLLEDFVTENMDTEYHHNFLQVGSTDYLHPKGIKYGIRGNLNGMKYYFFNVQAMVSSIKELTNVFDKQTEQYHQNKNQKQQQSTDDSEYSSAKIAESLNLNTYEREQLEAYFYTQLESFEKLWSFDNHTLEQLPQVIYEREQMLKNGKEFTYTKLKQMKEMALSFPTEMGFPFLYTYDTPLFIQFNGKIKAVATPEISSNNKLRMPDQVSAQVNAFVTVGSKVQSRLSVVTPFDHQMYVAGFDKNIQANVPIKANFEVDVKKHYVKVEFLVEDSQKTSNILHYSSWPYTSKVNIMSLVPVALSPNTHLIKPDSTHRSFDFYFGQKETGLTFRAWGHHPQQSKSLLEIARLIQAKDFATIWQLLWDDASMTQTQASIALIPDRSTTRKVIFYLRQQDRYQKQSDNDKREEFYSIDKLSSYIQQEPEQRQEAMLKHVGNGIQSAKLYSLDASVEFQGDKKYEHIFTFAYGKSNVAPQSNLVTFYRKQHDQQFNFAMQVKGDIPNTNELDLTYALNNNPYAKYEAFVQYGQNDAMSTKIRSTFDFHRSEERKEYIEHQPLYEVCKKQMQESNYHLYACQNITIEANYLDDIKIQVQYENFKQEHAKYIESIFKGIRVFYYPITEIKSIEPKEQNKMYVRVQYHPESLREVNITVRTHDEETRLFNLSISDMTKAVFVPHPVFHLKSRALGYIMGQENFRPTCVIDEHAAETFSNRTYPISVGRQWTLVMQYVPQEARFGRSHQKPLEQLRNQEENLAVLVRETSSDQREVLITLASSETEGKMVTILMKPQPKGSKPYASILVDDKEIQFNDKKAADLFNGFIEIYALPNGEVKMEIQNWFHLIFDGERVKLTATGDKLRDSIVGLCGRYNRDVYEDFWTPNNCIVKSAEKFVQSFVVEGKQQQDQSQQKTHECIPKVLPLYVNVISDNDVDRRDQEQRHSQSPNKIQYRNRYTEENGDLCFTIKPVPFCKNQARSYITKEVPVHCITKTKTAYYLKNQIDQGGNPDFSHKPETKSVRMEIPERC